MTQSNNAEDISRLHELFTRALQAEVFAGNPKELYEPFNYILSLGVKE
jgi:hypothetical protein